MIHPERSTGRLLAMVVLLVSTVAACDGVPETVQESTSTPAGDMAALAQTSWRLVSLSGRDLLPGTFATAVFGAANNLSGSAGCNEYSATYQVEGDVISITGLVPTAVKCSHPPGVMEQEMVYLAFLENAAGFKLQGKELVLSSADGELVATFVSAPSAPLQGTKWLLHAANDLQGAVVNPLAVTEITAIFGDDGTAAGSAGCNDYTAPYEVDGDTITIGPAAATEKLCTEPEGIMDQEAAFLLLLESATTYELLADTLILRNTAEEGVLLFTAAAVSE